MNKLFPEFRELVLFLVVEGGSHSLACRRAGASSRCSLQKVSVVALLPVLPNHVARTEIVNEKFEQIGLGGILPAWFP